MRTAGSTLRADARITYSKTSDWSRRGTPLTARTRPTSVIPASGGVPGDEGSRCRFTFIDGLLVRLAQHGGHRSGVGDEQLRGKDVGPTLAEAPEVDLVSFTGGVVTGRSIMASAAPTMKRVALELGGKNPNVISANADRRPPSTTRSPRSSSTPARSVLPVHGSSSSSRSMTRSSMNSSVVPRRSASVVRSTTGPRQDR